MTTATIYKTTEQLTDNELLMGLEALSRERMNAAFAFDLGVLTTFSHRDLVPGDGEYDGEHRITVEYCPSGAYLYYYRPAPYTMQMVCADRDAALLAIATYRPRTAVAS